MSIFQKVNRIMSLRSGIRNRLVQFGVVQGGAKLADCKDALDEMTDNTKKTTTSTAMTGTFSSGTTGRIFANPHEGYCSNDSLVSVPVVNLAAGNIKQGVNVGGVVGLYEGNYITGGTLTVVLRCMDTSNYARVHDMFVPLFDGNIGQNGVEKILQFNGPVIFCGVYAKLESYSGCVPVTDSSNLNGILFRATSKNVKIVYRD